MAVFPAGHILTSADFDTMFPVGLGQWQGYTPALNQGVAVAKTVNYARYMKVGRLVVASFYLTVTGTGTAATVIEVGTPTTGVNVGLPGWGNGMVFDSSVSTFWHGPAILSTVNTAKFAAYNAGNYLGAGGMTAALAAGDIVSGVIVYESAT